MHCLICQQLDSCPEYILEMIDKQKLSLSQRTEEWYRHRRSVITASEVSSLLGHNFFRTAEDVVVSKTLAIIHQDHCGSVISSQAIDWGVKYEDEAVEAFCKETGHKVISTGLLRHPSIPILAASPDGITYCGRVLEIKCPWACIGKTLTSVPKHYIDQVMTQLAVTGFSEAYFVQFRPAGFRDRGVPSPGTPQTLMFLTVDYDPTWLESVFPILECAYNDICRRVETYNKPILFDLEPVA